MKRLATSILVLTVGQLPACYEDPSPGAGDTDPAETDGTESSSAGASGNPTSGITTTGSPGTTDATGETMGGASTTQQATATASDGTTDIVTTGRADTSSRTGDSDSDSSESTGPAVDPVVSVSGRVRTGGLLTSPGLPNAAVSLWDDPTVSTVTDENGQFELVGVPANTLHHVVAVHPDYWSGINSMRTEGGDLNNFGVPMLPNSLVDGAVPEVFPNGDISAGVVFVVSSHVDTTVAASVAGISLLQPGLFYANMTAGLDVGSNVTQLPGYPVVGILNVPDQSPGGLVVSATHPSLDCTPTFSEMPPTMGTYATTVTVLCE